MRRRFLPVAFALLWSVLRSPAADVKITSLDRSGNLSWINAFASGITTIETAANPAGPWVAQSNLYTTDSAGGATVSLTDHNFFLRLLAVDISAGPEGFNNLVNSYGIIQTIAGKGEFVVIGSNNWRPEYEGGPATKANLSNPHFAMADNAGNIFVADKDSHAILKITPDGNIHTAAGNHTGGDSGDGPGQGTSLQLLQPNGEWVKSDGTVYIMDTGNNKIRRLDTNGIMSTVIFVPREFFLGRGLWVNDDETLAYIAANTKLLRWTPDAGVEVWAGGFNELGNLVVDNSGSVFVTDRTDGYVVRITAEGATALIAGNGGTGGVIDGLPALQTSLYGVRGIWPVPTGGFLLGTHFGSQVSYLDPSGIIYLLVDGYLDNSHEGDGGWFYEPGYKISNVRAVTMDRHGNIIITENDRGYVRLISFSRLQP